jgi:hypothetical protein
MGGLSSPTGLSQTPGLSIGDGLSVGDGLSFPGFGAGPTPPGPPGNNGILLENNTDFLMLEDGTSFLLQE